MDPDIIRKILVFMPALLLSLSFHEYAHAWTATKLGDGTPTAQGRLTLSPLPHIDPIGTLIFPLIMLASTSGIFFAWAKPVQFNPVNFSRKYTMKQGIMMTAVAGPLSNILLMILSLVLLAALIYLGVIPRVAGKEGLADLAHQFLVTMFLLNGFLAIFNLFPLPPLDGHHLLPSSMDQWTEKLHRYSFLIFILVFFIPIPGIGVSLGHILLMPFQIAMNSVLMSVLFG